MSTTPKPEKPYPEFPLTAHPSGQWSKKIRQKVHYFGSWADHEKALAKYVFQRDDLQAGRKPKPYPPPTTPEGAETTPGDGKAEDAGPRVYELVNRFLTTKQDARDGGELAPRTFEMYERTSKAFSAYFGRNRLLSDISAEDFEAYRKHLAKGRNLVSLGNEMRCVRVMFNYAYDFEIIDKPVRLKVVFKAPSKKAIRAANNLKPLRMLEAADLRRVIAAAGIPLRAMILLGANAGFGQGDISALPESALALKGGWLDFARVKTAVQRRCALWPETVDALRAAIAKRPKARTEEAKGKAFVTKYGSVFVRSKEGAQIDSVALEFGKLLTKLGLKRKGLNFYCLRSGFETIGGDSRDQIAVDFVMGHTPAANDMAAVYRRRITDERLRDLAEFVRKWLWPAGSEAAWLDSDDGKSVVAKIEALKAAKKPRAKRKPTAKRKSKRVPVSSL